MRPIQPWFKLKQLEGIHTTDTSTKLQVENGGKERKNSRIFCFASRASGGTILLE